MTRSEPVDDRDVQRPATPAVPAADVPPPDSQIMRVEIGGRTVWQAIGAILLTLVLMFFGGGVYPIVVTLILMLLFAGVRLLQEPRLAPRPTPAFASTRPNARWRASSRCAARASTTRNSSVSGASAGRPMRRRSAARASRARVWAFSFTRSSRRAASHSCGDTTGGDTTGGDTTGDTTTGDTTTGGVTTGGDTTGGDTSGGSTGGEALNILEGFDLGGVARDEALHLLIESSALGFADRNAYLGDSDFIDVPLAGLLSDEFAAVRRELIGDEALPKPVAAGDPWPFNGGGAAVMAEAAGGAADGSTTHLTVADKYGNVVSYTFTIEQIAGDMMDPESNTPATNEPLRGELVRDPDRLDRLIASAFHRNHRGNAENYFGFATAASSVFVSVSPCIRPMSSWYFSSTPRLELTVSGSRSILSSWTSALVQSMVSATPGSLNRSWPRSFWTKATTWRDSSLSTPGTLTLRISSSRLASG